MPSKGRGGQNYEGKPSRLPIVTVKPAPASAKPPAKVDAVVGGRRKSKRSTKSENVDPLAELPRATRSSAGSCIPVFVKQDDKVPAQCEVKKSTGALNKESESWRRPLSLLDNNRGESLTSAADLSDSVFADARSRLSSLADSCVKHRLSLSQGRRKSGSASPSRSRRSSPSSSDEVGKVLPSANNRMQFLGLPDGVIDIDIEEDGMVDYGSDMFAYMKEREEVCVVEEDYLDQSSVSPEMRAVLVDWLLQVQHYLKLSQETLYLGISLLDTILDKRDVEPDKLQLVGITSLYVASKCEEYYPADLKKLVRLTENSYREQDVFDMELVLLGVVNFQVYVPTAADFLPRICRAALRPSKEFLKTCLYLVDSHLHCATHPSTAPSLISAAAVLGSLLLHYTEANEDFADLSRLWTDSLHFYSTYLLEQVLPITQQLLVSLCHPKYTGARTKYKSRSQHSRLADLPHLAANVVKNAHAAACSKAP